MPQDGGIQEACKSWLCQRICCGFASQCLPKLLWRLVVLFRPPRTGRTLFFQFLLCICFSHCEIIGRGAWLSLLFSSPPVNWYAAEVGRDGMRCVESVLFVVSLARFRADACAPRVRGPLGFFLQRTVQWTGWSFERHMIARRMHCQFFSSFYPQDVVPTILFSFQRRLASTWRTVQKRP